MEATFQITKDRRTIDLQVSGIPGIQLPNGLAVVPVSVRIDYDRAAYGDHVEVRIDGRNEKGHLNSYSLANPEAWPTWLTELVDKYRLAEPIAPIDDK